jgi:hypothetical protein
LGGADAGAGIVLGLPVAGPSFGDTGGDVFTRPCAARQALTGFDGRSGGSVDRLQPACSTLSLAAAPANPPTSFQVTTGSAMLLAAAGGTGGSAFSDRCPANQVVIGINGRHLPEVGRFGFVCGSVVAARSGPSSPWQITVTRTVNSPQHGGTSGTMFEYLCPVGSVATVLGGRGAERIDQASISCSPVTVL